MNVFRQVKYFPETSGGHLSPVSRRYSFESANLIKETLLSFWKVCKEFLPRLYIK